MIPDRTTFTAVCARLRCYGPGIREGADVIEHLMARDRALKRLIVVLAVIAFVAGSLLVAGWRT